ncbi:unnamed protein product [Cunninghamella echinulata]
MTSITKFETGHENLIHGIAYNYYGKRLVTCSSDQRLKVWDFIERQNSAIWESNDAWKAHDASIMKALWAPAEYGQIIASCSFDRTVKIWEEQPVEPKNSQRRWSEQFQLVESKGAVLDIASLQIQGALRLATCSADGIIRIYEAIEPTNLSQWSQMEEFSIEANKDNATSTAMTSSNSSLLSQQQQQQQLQDQSLHMEALLEQQQQQHLRQLHQQQQQLLNVSLSPSSQDDHRQQQRNNDQDNNPSNSSTLSARRQATLHLGTSPPALPPPPPSSSSSLAFQQHAPLRTPSSSSSGNSNTMDHYQLPFGTHPATPGLPPPAGYSTTNTLTMSSIDQYQSQQEAHHHRPIDLESGYCIDWCPNRSSTALMVVGLGKEHGAKIFKHDGHNRWYPGENLPGHSSQVNDVSWAPSMGRTYQLIATACKDHYVRIFKLTDTVTTPSATRANMLNKQMTKPSRSFHIELIAEFNHHHAEVWRVEWNIMGTVLSSTGSDGTVRLWRAGYDGEWRKMAVINTSSSNQQ